MAKAKSDKLAQPQEAREPAMPMEFHDLLRALRARGFVPVNHGPQRDGDHWRASLTREAAHDA
jgi:hypothetical protein